MPRRARILCRLEYVDGLVVEEGAVARVVEESEIAQCRDWRRRDAYRKAVKIGQILLVLGDMVRIVDREKVEVIQ